MDDELLNRARALMSAMNAMNAEQTVAIERATHSMTLIDKQLTPKENANNNSGSKIVKSPLKQKLKPSITSSTPVEVAPTAPGDPNSFRGAAISGSTIITTFQDMRNAIKRGGTLLIDNVPYTISMSGEFSANRIELSQDYAGQTNLDAFLSTSLAVKPTKSTRRAHSPRPVSPGALMSAVTGLEDIAKMVTTISRYY